MHHKSNIEMCNATFELLIDFLQGNKHMLLLAIVNRFLNIRGACAW